MRQSVLMDKKQEMKQKNLSADTSVEIQQEKRPLVKKTRIRIRKADRVKLRHGMTLSRKYASFLLIMREIRPKH